MLVLHQLLRFAKVLTALQSIHFGIMLSATLLPHRDPYQKYPSLRLIIRLLFITILLLFHHFVYVIWISLVSYIHFPFIHPFLLLSLFFSFIISYSNQGQDANVDQIPDYDQVLGDLADDDYNMLSNLSGYVVN